MKAVPEKEGPAPTIEQAEKSLLKRARQHELSGDSAAALETYEAALKKFPLEINVYNRLMILYRKQKAYKKEMALLNKAIETFTRLFQPGKSNQSRKVASLSKSILQTVGLSDKKGHSLYVPEPIARWEKRKKIVQQKLTGAS